MIWNAIARRFREYFYLVASFPVAIFFFILVNIGFSKAFLPLAVLLFLGLLSVMQWVARVEIRRTNSMLKTDFQVVENWFRFPFFSWDGAKERITSLRSWMAILYVLCAFGISSFGFGLSVVILAGIFTILLSLNAIAIGNFDRSWEFNTENTTGPDELIRIHFNFFGDANQFRINIQGLDDLDKAGNQIVSGSFDGFLVIAISVVVILLAIWLSLGISRVIARLVDGLLSGSYKPQFESWLQRFTAKTNVSEQEVRRALSNESIQNQISALTNREREILALMAQGKSNAAIARELYVTREAVEKHVTSIMNKLGIRAGDESHRRVLAVLTYLGLSPKEGNRYKV